MEDLVAQRVYGFALGYEDLNDHDLLRRDPLVAAAVGKSDPQGEGRRRQSDRGSALAGKSTLNRLELRSDDPRKDGRYKKIALDGAKVALGAAALIIVGCEEIEPQAAQSATQSMTSSSRSGIH